MTSLFKTFVTSSQLIIGATCRRKHLPLTSARTLALRALVTMATRRPFLLDCDTGTDDAQAILMALVHPDVQLVAVTTVFGNTTCENTTRNTLRILKYKGRTDIPVFRGSDRSLLGAPTIGDGFHGEDGLGDVTLADIDPVDMSIIQTEHAAQAIVRLANERPGELTVVATGPLTNLALALHLDPQLGTKLRDVCIMGGNVEGRGNITVSGEFNFVSDPEAANFVLNHFGRLATLAPLEVCERHSFSWDWYDKFLQTDSPTAKLIATFESKVTTRLRSEGIASYVMIWDQVAMAAAINSAVAVATEDVYVSVELHGEQTRGQMVVDWRHKLSKPANARVITKVDQGLFEQLMYGILEH